MPSIDSYPEAVVPFIYAFFVFFAGIVIFAAYYVIADFRQRREKMREADDEPPAVF